jgi:hypothetical protein
MPCADSGLVLISADRNPKYLSPPPPPNVDVEDGEVEAETSGEEVGEELHRGRRQSK